MADIITIVDYTAYKWFSFLFVWILAYLLSISYLCMLCESNLLKIELEQNVVKLVLIVVGLVFITADYCLILFFNWSLVLTKIKVCNQSFVFLRALTFNCLNFSLPTGIARNIVLITDHRPIDYRRQFPEPRQTRASVFSLILCSDCSNMI